MLWISYTSLSICAFSHVGICKNKLYDCSVPNAMCASCCVIKLGVKWICAQNNTFLSFNSVELTAEDTNGSVT